MRETSENESSVKKLSFIPSHDWGLGLSTRDLITSGIREGILLIKCCDSHNYSQITEFFPTNL